MAETDKEIHTHTHTHTYSSGLDIPIFSKLYDLYKLFNQYLLLFPKAKRYSLGQKIDQLMLEIIELTITAGYLPKEQKLSVLQRASVKLDLLKILLRLSFETKCLDNKKYQQLVLQIVEVGRMLGGWIKATIQ